MQRPVLHNRYLSDDLHRLANGAIGAMLSLILTTLAVRYLGCPLSLLWLCVPADLLGTVLPPSRFMQRSHIDRAKCHRFTRLHVRVGYNLGA
jgi:hypothetical protein